MTHPRRSRGRGGQQGHEPRARIQMREARALELSVKGWTQHQIAAELGVTQAAVSKILRRLEERHFRESAAILDRHKARHTQRLEFHFAESMRAWEESKQDSTIRRQRKAQSGAGGGDGQAVAELVVENQHGNPRYLEQARKALADIRKVWGIEAPQQLRVTAQQIPYEGMTEAQLTEEIERRQALLTAGTPGTEGQTDGQD